MKKPLFTAVALALLDEAETLGSTERQNSDEQCHEEILAFLIRTKSQQHAQCKWDFC